MDDTGIGGEVLIILLLVVANGVFAMSEIAVVSARKARLRTRAEAGDADARVALELAEQPNRFLSTIQIGITLIGILAGAYGGATLAAPLGEYLARVPALARYSSQIALGIVVAAITFVSLVVGELVPKRIALLHPERIASALARPMHYISIAATPLVALLGATTDVVLRVLGVKRPKEPPITEEELTLLIEQGTEAGVFEEEEQELVSRVFWLGDQRAASLMTPRQRVVWLDVDASDEEIRTTLRKHRFSRYPVCRGNIDRVIGIVDVRDLVARAAGGEAMDIRRVMRQPLFVPDSIRALRLLELFRESGVHFAIVVDEFGGTDGVITLNNVLEAIAGHLVEPEGERFVRRPDGSWLVDAAVTMDEFWDELGLPERRTEGRRAYSTLGGFVVTHLGRIPAAGDSFEAFGLRFEVVDMDGRRVDKVLVAPTVSPAPEGGAEGGDADGAGGT
jgi:putative hemolysin